MWLALKLSVGVLASAASLFLDGWLDLLRFLLAAGVVVLILWGWCAHLAVASVRATMADAAVCNDKRKIVRHTGAVVGAVLLELLLPVFLLLALITLIEAVIQLLGITDVWRAFAQGTFAVLRDAWSMPPERLHQAFTCVLGAFDVPPAQCWPLREGMSAAETAAHEVAKTGEGLVKEGVAIVTGTISAATSLVLFLLRRRQVHLTAARVIAEEVRSVVRGAFNAIPYTLTHQANLINLPHNTLLIGASSERELLLLHPSTEHPTKLPICLLPSAVAFFHADLALNQSYNAITGPAFAQADQDRRKTYFGFLGEEWATYETTAFATLLKLAFYQRLRRWTI